MTAPDGNPLWLISDGWEATEDKIEKCPQCRTLFVRHTGTMPYTQTPTRWSDGYRDRRYYPIKPLITKCTTCKRWYHVYDLESLFRCPPDDYSTLTQEITREENTTIDEYEEALLQEWEKESELMIRERLLWLQNQPLREEESISVFTNQSRIEEVDNPCLFNPYLLIDNYRELGDFSKADELLKKHEEQIKEKVKGFFTISQIAIENDDTAPLPLPEDDSEREYKQASAKRSIENIGFSYEERREHGYDLFPLMEDVFGFAYEDRDGECEPMLSVRLSLINEKREGWATFFYDDHELLHRHDRLFTKKEWNAFERYAREYREELIWFWSFKSWEKPRNEEELNRYFRIKYQHYHDINEYIAEEQREEHRRIFNKYFTQSEKALLEHFPDMASEMSDYRTALYWNVFWATFKDDNFEWNADELEGKLEDAYHDMEDYDEGREVERREAFDGLAYVELGGFPRWFQGHDQTPVGPGGNRMTFIGQVWTDYLKYASKLVYLFYDPEAGFFNQVHDYD